MCERWPRSRLGHRSRYGLSVAAPHAPLAPLRRFQGRAGMPAETALDPQSRRLFAPQRSLLRRDCARRYTRESLQDRQAPPPCKGFSQRRIVTPEKRSDLRIRDIAPGARKAALNFGALGFAHMPMREVRDQLLKLIGDGFLSLSGQFPDSLDGPAQFFESCVSHAQSLSTVKMHLAP